MTLLNIRKDTTEDIQEAPVVAFFFMFSYSAAFYDVFVLFSRKNSAVTPYPVEGLRALRRDHVADTIVFFHERRFLTKSTFLRIVRLERHSAAKVAPTKPGTPPPEAFYLARASKRNFLEKTIKFAVPEIPVRLDLANQNLKDRGLMASEHQASGKTTLKHIKKENPHLS